MNFSKTTTYALRVLIFMANNDQIEITAGLLSSKLKIQPRYLRRLLTDLVKSGFIQSKRGKNGGFTFAKSINSIYLSDIIDAVEGIKKFDSCFLGNEDCDLIVKCDFHNLFNDTRKNMIDTLKTNTLHNLKMMNLTN